MENQEEFICPLCEQGKLVANQSDTEEGSYKGKSFKIDYESSFCTACGLDMVTPPQAVRNQARVRDEQRKIDGLLTSSEIKQIREKLHLSFSEADEIFGEETNTFSRFERGEALQSASLDRLLRLANDMPVILDKLKLLSNMK